MKSTPFSSIPVIKYASYVRVSSYKQKMDDTVVLQRSCNTEAIQQLGGKPEHVLEFEDKAVSGYNRVASKREGIQKLVNAVRNGFVDVVVFSEESRLSRRILDFYIDVYIPIIEVNPGIKFYRSSDGTFWDPNSREAKNNLILAFDESDKKSRLAKESIKRRFKEGKRPGAKLPLGIERIVGDSLIPDERFPIVLFIFELASFGYSERHIAKILNRMSLLLDGNEWGHTEIHYILKNPLYAGHLAIGRRRSKENGALKSLDELNRDQLKRERYQPLVPVALWDMVQMELKNKSYDKSIRTARSFLLSGILTCALCNQTLKAKNSTKKNIHGEIKKHTRKGSLLRYYYCETCGKRIDPDRIETEVTNVLSKELERNITLTKIRNKVLEFQREVNRRIKDFKNELQVRRYQLNVLTGGYYNKTWDRETVDLLVRCARESVAELESAVREGSELQESLASLAERKDIFQRFVQRARQFQDVLPEHEVRYFIERMVTEVRVRVSRAGEPIIDELIYRDLPLPYIYQELDNINSI